MSLEHLDPCRNGNEGDGAVPTEPQEDQVFEPINLTREDTKETEDPNHYNIMDGEEKGGADGIPEPVGFWHTSMGNVRSHVLNLWFRTGKRSRPPPAIANYTSSQKIIGMLTGTTSHDLVCVHSGSTRLVLWGI